MLHKLLEDKENKELVSLLLDAVSTDVFVYGGSSWNDLFKVLGSVNNSQFASVKALLGGADPLTANKAQMNAMLLSVQKNRELVKVPDLVLGFKVKDAKKAQAQLGRLEALASAHLKEVPELKGRFKRTMVGSDSFLTLTLDGGLLPWDDIQAWIKDQEEKADEFAPLIKHLKAAKLTVSLGVRGGFLLLGVGSEAKDLTKLGGTGKRLIDRDELKPLTKALDKPLTTVGYVSKAFRAAAAGSSNDLAQMGKSLKGLLEVADLSAARKKAIEKDLDAMIKDIQSQRIELGAAVSFEYLIDNGYENWAYDYSQHPGVKGARFKLRDHLGGNPIFAAGVGTRISGQGYATFSKYVKAFYGHAEAIFLEKVPDDDIKDAYKKYAGIFLPLFKQLDETTSKLLLPSLTDASFALVLDGKWKSKRWHAELPEAPEAMPMAELGLLVSLADAGKFQKALREYRTILNELYAKAREEAPNKENIPEFKIPAPESDKGKGGTFYYYPIPKELGLDKQFVPTGGVSKTVAALTLSRAHTERLLTPNPLKVKGGPLAAKKDVIALTYVNWPALIDLAGPWVEFGVMTVVPARRPGADKGGDAGDKKVAEIQKQVRVVLDALKAFEGYSSATYLEEGVLVRHGQATFKDR
jgi:hypothetical protein